MEKFAKFLKKHSMRLHKVHFPSSNYVILWSKCFIYSCLFPGFFLSRPPFPLKKREPRTFLWPMPGLGVGVCEKVKNWRWRRFVRHQNWRAKRSNPIWNVTKIGYFLQITTKYGPSNRVLNVKVCKRKFVLPSPNLPMPKNPNPNPSRSWAAKKKCRGCVVMVARWFRYVSFLFYCRHFLRHFFIPKIKVSSPMRKKMSGQQGEREKNCQQDIDTGGKPN